MKRTLSGLATALALVVGMGSPETRAEGSFITVQSTTSTQNSGLYEYLLPIYKAKTGVDVHVVAVGTGQALKNAQNCDGDVVLVHAKAAEMKFVESGYGVKRTDLMYNDFIVVGAPADPAGVKGSNDAVVSLKKIAETKSPFASRGDDSGTNTKELQLWQAAGIDPKAASGGWYRETGSGMGATLNTGIGMGAYVLTDRATWISFGNKGDYRIEVEKDPNLFNQYGVILVSPKKCPNVKADLGQQFIDWLLGADGQETIGKYMIDGQQLFFPNAPAM